MIAHGKIFALKIACAAMMTLAGMAGVAAQTVQDFYKGKTISVQIGYTPGGGYDQYARVLARHMTKHVPAVVSG